jgi:prophage antirepressor-like protein
MDSSMNLSNPNPFEVFNHPAFGFVRVVVKDGEPWFVGKDVAEVLGYKDPKGALAKHVDGDDKMMGSQNDAPSIIDNLGRLQSPVFINESGLYSLMLRSKLPQAREFKRWVTSEVLPSIRKHIDIEDKIMGEQNGHPSIIDVDDTLIQDITDELRTWQELFKGSELRPLVYLTLKLKKLPYLTCERFYLPCPYVSLRHFKLFLQRLNHYYFCSI